MTKLLYKIIFIVSFSISINGFAREALVDNITWLSEEHPPYNFLDNTKTATGLSVNIVDHILKQTKSLKNINNIKIITWNQAYQMALDNPNCALFVTARTFQREKLFKWVGPIASSKIVAFSKKISGIKLNDITEIKNFKVAAIKNDVAQQLVTHALPDFSYTSVNNLQEALEKLNSNQVDIIVGDYNVLSYLAIKNKLNFLDYQTCYEIKDVEYWIAFNLKTSDNLVKELQNIVDTIDD